MIFTVLISVLHIMYEIELVLICILIVLCLILLFGYLILWWIERGDGLMYDERIYKSQFRNKWWKQSSKKQLPPSQNDEDFS